MLPVHKMYLHPGSSMLPVKLYSRSCISTHKEGCGQSISSPVAVIPPRQPPVDQTHPANLEKLQQLFGLGKFGVLATFGCWQHLHIGNISILATYAFWQPSWQHLRFSDICLLATLVLFWQPLGFGNIWVLANLRYGDICILGTFAF